MSVANIDPRSSKKDEHDTHDNSENTPATRSLRYDLGSRSRIFFSREDGRRRCVGIFYLLKEVI
jgi:hypothetical protein